jgi:hypothetical protein
MQPFDILHVYFLQDIYFVAYFTVTDLDHVLQHRI